MRESDVVYSIVSTPTAMGTVKTAGKQTMLDEIPDPRDSKRGES
jgi:hypothetical protein